MTEGPYVHHPIVRIRLVCSGGRAIERWFRIEESWMVYGSRVYSSRLPSVQFHDKEGTASGRINDELLPHPTYWAQVWFHETQAASLALLVLGKRRTIHKDVARLLARAIWATRTSHEWQVVNDGYSLLYGR